MNLLTISREDPPNPEAGKRKNKGSVAAKIRVPASQGGAKGSDAMIPSSAARLSQLNP